MKSALVLALAALSLSSSLADISVSDYIFWKKADINTWNKFFPSRALEEERLTIQAAATAVTSLSDSLNYSLEGVVAFQGQELQTAWMLMNGTDAEGCVRGIAGYMDKAIDDEVSTYSDCAADSLSKLYRLNITLARTKAKYLAAYQRALSGIDTCARTYPNKDSIDRLQSCVESMNKNYFAAANSTQDSVKNSQAMRYFQDVVVGCASDAALGVAAKGAQFLKMLTECATLSETIDIDTYKEQLNKWTGYKDTLASQISEAQTKNLRQIRSVEQDIQTFYSLQKQALETYVIESRGLDYYLKSMYAYLGDYYNTVIATSMDNPGEPLCSATARQALDNVAGTGAAKSLGCDLEIVNNTKQLIKDVNDIFSGLNMLMPIVGNSAVLDCFSRGYVFAPNTISDCFNLVYSGFDVEYEDRHTDVVSHLLTLSSYEGFFSGYDLPCGGTSLRRLLLGGDRALYNLQRCLYTSSGTVYSVTTPSALTTTPTTIPSTPSTTTITITTTPSTTPTSSTPPTSQPTHVRF